MSDASSTCPAPPIKLRHTSEGAWGAHVCAEGVRVYPAGVSNEAEVPSLTTDDLCALLQVSRPVVQQLRQGMCPAS